MVTEPHPAYTKETLATTIVRNVLLSPNLKLPNDLDKGIAKIYELSKLQNPPVRLQLGKDSIQAVRTQIASVAGELDHYESWSDDLLRDD